MTILLITYPLDPHLEYVAQKLQAQSENFYVFDFTYPELPSHVSCRISGEEGLSISITGSNNEQVCLSDVKSVWNRRLVDPLVPNVHPSDVIDPKVRYIRKENVSLLRSFHHVLKDRLWLPDPISEEHAGYKPIQLSTAVQLGLDIPETWAGNAPAGLVRFLEDITETNQFALKALHSAGYSANPPKGLNALAWLLNTSVFRFSKKKMTIDTGMYSPTVVMEREALVDCAYAVRNCPVQVQTYVEKLIELRITIVGDRIFTCAIDSQKLSSMKHDWRAGGAEALSSVQSAYTLPVDIQEKCFQLTKALGLNFGCIDMIVTPEKRYVFLEINPNGQWGWLERDLGFDISGAIANLLIHG